MAMANPLPESPPCVEAIGVSSLQVASGVLVARERAGRVGEQHTVASELPRAVTSGLPRVNELSRGVVLGATEFEKRSRHTAGQSGGVSRVLCVERESHGTVLDIGQIRQLLTSISSATPPSDNSPDDAIDHSLDSLSINDFTALQKAADRLTTKTKDKTLDVLLRLRVTAMLGTIKLWINPQLDYTWRRSSLIMAMSLGRGVNFARSIRTWVHHFLRTGNLPLHHYGRFHSSVLEDEDFSQGLQLHLLEVSKSKRMVCAQDIVDYIASGEVQDHLTRENGGKPVTISIRTGQRWLTKLSWRYSRVQKGMYVDGHEREDVVAYRREFIQ